MINRMKTIILTILILIAVYQMFELWFDDYSNRNFFYSQITSIGKKNNTGIEYKYGLEPEKIVISSGNPQYTVLNSTDEDTVKLENELKRILNKVVDNEPNVSEETVNIKDILDNKAILY